MTRGDQLDAALAKHFAWRFVRPGDTAHVAELLRLAGGGAVPDARDELSDDEGSARLGARARAACRALALGVAEAWALTEEDASVRATKRLLVRAERLNAAIVGMEAHPREAVRLLRLFVRNAGSMTRRQHERAGSVAALTPRDHAEAADLFVEVARAADREIAQALLSGGPGDDGDGAWDPRAGEADSLAARLADVIDAGPTHACRSVAIDLLTCLKGRRAAVPAVRRALRVPEFSVRARALHALATATPCAVSEEDLVQVLRDLAANAPPDAPDDEHEEDERLLADAVVAALAHVQPSEAEEALLDIIDAEHPAVWLDAGWATEALAVAFPETAVAMVDHWLKCTHAHERTRALPALERLPDDLAEMRLCVAANDPALIVRESARRQWLQRFDRVRPMGTADVAGAALIAGPASERFMARLAVMHGRVREAKQGMARALLAEAPDREALVLLLQLVGDDVESREPTFGSAAFQPEAWAVTLVRRFGALGVEGLCALAARFPEPESFGWMRRLGDLVERGVIDRADAGPLRELAAGHVRSEDSGRVDDSLRVLAMVAAPPEMLDRILAIALEDDIGASEARALIVNWPERAVDARLASEMALGLAGRDWARLHHASWMALERGAPAARVIAQRVLEVAEHEPDAADAAVECARRLRDAGVLDQAWVLAALARPESPMFVVAARAWRRDATVSGSLETALTSPARGGVSAVQAAISLLHGDPGLSPRDRRLVAVLDSVGPSQRAELVHAMCMHGAPLAIVGPKLEELLVSTDPKVTGPLVGVAGWLTSPRARALLRAALPRLVDAELRADIEESLAGNDSYRSLR
jgi:hypothetical protein